MKKQELFRSIAPGLLPLIILVIAEMIWGMMTGVIVVACFSILELTWHLLRHKRFEKSILLDIGLMSILGIAAYFIEGEQLEKYKILFYMALILVFVGISAFSNYNIAAAQAGRYFKNLRIGPWGTLQMRQTMKLMFWSILIYTCATILALSLLSENIGNFLGNTGIFIAFAVVFLIDFIRKRYLRQKMKDEEWLPIIDAAGKVIGHAPRFAVHNGKTRWLHPVVHLHIIQKNGIWLQKRPMHKLVQPGKWDTAVGGHLDMGESIEKALVRETHEEIGINITNPVVLGQYLWESSLEREMVFSFALIYNGEIIPDSKELDGGRLWKFSEIDANLGKDVFTPNFEHEYRLFKEQFINLAIH